MLVLERQREIAKIVNQKGSVRVAELSQMFNVTVETIRKDLDVLEEEGKLRRSHGGALKVNTEQSEIPYFEREIINVHEKMEIAAEAIKLISPGDQIILDTSSTAWFMARSMPNIPMTILTNSVKVITELADKEKIAVIAIGGDLAPRSMSFVGPLAERSLDMYHVSKAFISCKGLHLKHGPTESNEQQAIVKRKMIEIADECYLLVDHSKFDFQSFTNICGLERITMIVTDSKIDAQHVNALKQCQVRVAQIDTVDASED